METKITLKIDQELIEKAKSYAVTRKTSLSKLVAAYLVSITSGDKPEVDEEITPVVKSLSGIISLPANTNSKEPYSEHIANKYLDESKNFVTKVEIGLKQAEEGKTISHEEELKHLRKK